MHSFRFRLQTVLDLRRHQADQKKLELGAISQRCERLRRSIAERRAERRAALVRDDPGVAAHDIGYRRSVEAYAARLEREAQDLTRRLEDAERERLQAVEEYREARRNADVLERLRERRWSTYLAEKRREEQLRLDEVSQHLAYRE